MGFKVHPQHLCRLPWVSETRRARNPRRRAGATAVSGSRETVEKETVETTSLYRLRRDGTLARLWLPFSSARVTFVNSRAKKVPPLTYFLMGPQFSIKNRLYVGGAVVLLMAMSLLTVIHVYTAINPPTIVLAIQPGGNKPQYTFFILV